MIKAVLFDIDGVLVDSFEANRKFFGDLLTSFGYDAPTQEEFAGAFHMSMKATIEHFTKSTDEKEIQIIWSSGKDHDAPHHLWKMSQNYEQIIELLSKNYSLGIVTSKMKANIYKAPQMKLIEKYFKTAVGYDDVANHKPHPEPLLLAVTHLGVLPEEAVYIGDMPTDVEAAKSAGMKIIHFSKNPLSEVDAFTDSFTELPSIIKNL